MLRLILLALSMLFVAGCGATGSQRAATPFVEATVPAATGTVAEATFTSPPPAGPEPTAGPSSQFFAVDFISADVGWALGADGIFSTTNGGQHWEPSFSRARDTATDIDIDFVDAETGFAIEPIPDVVGGSRSGGVDFFLTTSDGGQHWQAPNWTPYRFTRIVFVSAVTGWAVGYKEVDAPGTLFHTDDGGHTWTEALLPAESLCFGDANTGWVANTTDVMHTVDGGATWATSLKNPVTDQGFATGNVTIQCAGRDSAWVQFAGGIAAGSRAYAVFRTLDGGAHWDPVMQGRVGPALGTHTGSGNSPGPITVLDAAEAWVMGSCGPCEGPDGVGTSFVEATHDGGLTWDAPVTIPGAGASPQALQFIDPRHGWLASTNGIFATADGGRTWVKQR